MADALLEVAAAEFVQSYGSLALPVLQERAEIAEERDHRVSAEIWREMAGAAERILEEART